MGFKVGDRVRIIYNIYHESIAGYIGTVVSIDDNFPTDSLVRFDKTSDMFHHGHMNDEYKNNYYWVGEQALELIVHDCKLNRALYPELTPDGEGNLV